MSQTSPGIRSSTTHNFSNYYNAFALTSKFSISFVKPYIKRLYLYLHRYIYIVSGACKTSSKYFKHIFENLPDHSLAGLNYTKINSK